MSCANCGDSCVGGCGYSLPRGTTMSVEDRCSCGPGSDCWYCRRCPAPAPDPMKPTAATIRAQIEKAKRDIDDAKYVRYEARVWSEIRSMLALSKLEGHINLDRDCDSIGDRLWREVEAAGYRLNLRYLRLTITVPETTRDD